ncbi:MAG TPA: hypothetical protein VF479_07690 [Pseudolysinimonas sp.]
MVDMIDLYSNLSNRPLHPEKIEELIRRSHEGRPPSRRNSKAFRLDRRLGKKMIDSLITRYEAGETIPALAAECGVSRSGLGDLLRRHGVTLRYQPMTNTEIKRAIQRYSQGAPLSQLATEFNASQETIRKMLIRHGVAMRPARRR